MTSGLRSVLVAIDQYRIDHDLSWPRLSVAMTEAGVGIPARTLHYLCRRAHPDITVRDKTLRRLHAFLQLKGVAVDPNKRRAVLINKPQPAPLAPLPITKRRSASRQAHA